ncbi:MAG: putative inorganic carbon transporter subunit DabA, partial [Halobacteria archaeon]|nr:putative inorganic carbon transporter subunit DabA [Halobacteria archaeon]
REHGSDVHVDACPPILSPEHRVEEQPDGSEEAERHRYEYDRWERLVDAGQHLVKALQTNAATAFNFVETAGSGYGVALAARTLLPSSVYDLIEYAANAFEMMGWEEFARLVVFVGHKSQTANNPFGSSLDCGACAGNPGGPNARVLAEICNDEEVKNALGERGIEIPDDTVFVAGEHNTTTDEVTLYSSEVPETHEDEMEKLERDLEKARKEAAAERVGADEDDKDAIQETQRRAADWAETRPEWGLAGNASFVIGGRELTADLNLDGRAFLHSYNWEN